MTFNIIMVLELLEIFYTEQGVAAHFQELSISSSPARKRSKACLPNKEATNSLWCLVDADISGKQPHFYVKAQK